MQAVRNLLRGGLAALLVSLAVAPAGATTLIRQGLDRLVAGNTTIVVGEVLDTSLYWNLSFSPWDGSPGRRRPKRFA